MTDVFVSTELELKLRSKIGEHVNTQKTFFGAFADDVVKVACFPENFSAGWRLLHALEEKYLSQDNGHLPYRLVYKTHFFAPKLNIKRRGASCT